MRLRGNAEPAFRFFQHAHRVCGQRERGRHLRNVLAIGPGEPQRAVVGDPQAIAAFVQQAVMPAAKLDQVGERGFAAIAGSWRHACDWRAWRSSAPAPPPDGGA
jgi:hypothetical protein